MPLSNLSNALIEPSPLKSAILHILILLIDAVMAIKIWLIPKLVALCHTVGKVEIMDLMICCQFIYFATAFRPANFAMLLPVNEALIFLIGLSLYYHPESDVF